MGGVRSLARGLVRRQPTALVFASYEGAAAACGRGYENAALLEVVHEKTVRYRDSLLGTVPEIDTTDGRLLLGLLLAGGDELRVIDFGGACGAHYLTARAALPGVAFEWCVVESGAMVKRAKDMEDGALSFVESIDEACARIGVPDLVFSSGALQYVPDPESALAALVTSGARVLLLTRLGLFDGRSPIFTVQDSTFAANGRGPLPPSLRDGRTKYPLTISPRQRVEKIITSRYLVRGRFVEERGAYRIGSISIDQSGYVAVRR